MGQRVSILAALKIETPWRELTPERIELARSEFSTLLSKLEFKVDPDLRNAEVIVDRVIARAGGDSDPGRFLGESQG